MNDVDDDEGEILPETAGENLVGGNSLMWNTWVLPETAAGRNGLLISFAEERLQQNWVTRHFAELSEITKEVLRDGDDEIGHFYWRVGYNYNPD